MDLKWTKDVMKLISTFVNIKFIVINKSYAYYNRMVLREIE